MEHIKDFADVLLSLEDLKDLNLPESVEQDAISVVEIILFALLHRDELCRCRICLKSELSIVLRQDLVELLKLCERRLFLI